MKKLFIISGPTAIGKTDLGIQLAQRLGVEIISADSRQMYRELKIGTAPPSQQQLSAVKHHFIGNLSIHDYYNASMYEVSVLSLLGEMFKNKDVALMVGGSGMYIDAVCSGIDDLPTVDMELRNSLMETFKNEGIESLRMMLHRLDPKYYSVVDLKNPQRILKGLEVSIMTGKPYSSFLSRSTKKRDFEIVKIGLNRDRAELHEIINHRVDKMLEAGLLDEAKEFYPFKNINSLNTVGYRELFDYFEGKISENEAIELIKRNTRRYARRQISWLHRDNSLIWFHPNQLEEIWKTINR